MFSTLHEPVTEPSKLMNREKLISLLEENPKQRLDLQMILSKIGKSSYSALSSFCYDVNSKRLKNLFIYKILTFLPLVFIALFFVYPIVGFSGFLLASILNGFVHYYVTTGINSELAAIRYFSIMLWGANKISEEFSHIDNPIFEELNSSFQIFKSIGGKLSALGHQILTEMDTFIEYFRILTLSQIRHYNKVIDILEKNPEAFKKLYTSLGEIDIAVCILSYRKSLTLYSLPEFITENQIVAKNIYHPLVKDSVLNSASITKNSLVSGSNASGKSTFIKSIVKDATARVKTFEETDHWN